MKERELGWNHLVGYCNTSGERENEPELIGWVWGERGYLWEGFGISLDCPQAKVSIWKLKQRFFLIDWAWNTDYPVMSKTMPTVSKSPACWSGVKKERIFSPGRVKGYSCHPDRQDPTYIEVMCVHVCMCKCAYICACVSVVPVTWNPEERYMASFCYGRVSISTSDSQKVPQ